MPATTELKENEHVIYQVLSSPLTIEELSDSVQIAEGFMNESDHVLHTLINMTQVNSLPLGVFRYSGASTLSHEKSGNVLVVGQSSIVKRLVETMLKIARYKRVKFFSTEEEAWQHARDLVKNGE